MRGSHEKALHLSARLVGDAVSLVYALREKIAPVPKPLNEKGKPLFAADTTTANQERIATLSAKLKAIFPQKVFKRIDYFGSNPHCSLPGGFEDDLVAAALKRGRQTEDIYRRFDLPIEKREDDAVGSGV